MVPLMQAGGGRQFRCRACATSLEAARCRACASPLEAARCRACALRTAPIGLLFLLFVRVHVFGVDDIIGLFSRLCLRTALTVRAAATAGLRTRLLHGLGH